MCIRDRWYNCHRTHRSVAYCIQISQGNLCGVHDLLQSSQKCRVLWCNCHRTHSSIGYCGTAVTELTDVLCRVETEGNYPRYRSVGTLQNLSVEITSVFASGHRNRLDFTMRAEINLSEVGGSKWTWCCMQHRNWLGFVLRSKLTCFI